MWPALREKVPNVLSHCHTKRRMPVHPSFGMTPTFQMFFFLFFYFYFLIFFSSRCHTKRRLGTFLRNAAHITNTYLINAVDQIYSAILLKY